MKKSQQIGILLTIIGAFCIYWTYNHSPNADIGKKIGNFVSGSYTMSPTGYYLSLALGIGLVIWGIMKLVRGK